MVSRHTDKPSSWPLSEKQNQANTENRFPLVIRKSKATVSCPFPFHPSQNFDFQNSLLNSTHLPDYTKQDVFIFASCLDHVRQKYLVVFSDLLWFQLVSAAGAMQEEGCCETFLKVSVQELESKHWFKAPATTELVAYNLTNSHFGCQVSSNMEQR